ncbi:uncharacterized protein LOC129225842 isoform X2 [Uloborus diversus]|uniref:uncharacterized protein LOC129225842 isoform X2 n=1 Tax=Uloborus diversus TaxID=327109 RepID=UPI00240A1164|nr:uncharacterized protein LOC129225842 isoform X2 [Uloborus diversus]
MPPKKIFKSSRSLRSSSNSKPDDVCCDLYFDLLPNEILAEIVKFLTPQDIYHFLQVCSPRCAELAHDLKSVSYDTCRRVESDHVLVLFKSVRTTNIVEINFNNVCHTNVSVLVSAIVKCKQLITLSIINCGISIINVVRVLQECKKIENFSWDAHVPTNMEKARDCVTGFHAPQLKNVFLSLNIISRNIEIHYVQWFLNVMLNLSPTDVNMYLNYSSVPIFRPVRLCKSFQLNLPSKVKPVSFFSDLYSTNICMEHYKSVLRSIMRSSFGCSLRFESIVAVKEYLKSLKWPKLKNLSVQECTDSNNELAMLENVNRTRLQVSPLISLFMLNAPNITTLNFAGIHVGHDLPINDISCLKSLADISIPTCGMQLEPSSGEKLTEREFAFLEVITTCTEVKRFSLEKCLVCSEAPNEEQLMHLKHWRKMMDLSISNVPALRVCRFLRAVADSCPDLRVIQLTSLGHGSVCHYIPNVIYVLKTSKRLQLLRLYQEAFYLGNTLFWNAIKSASNLEGLCISSKFNSYPPVQQMISALSELKFFYMLHLKVKHLPLNFEYRFRKVLRDQKVKAPQLNVSSVDTFLCSLYHFGYPCFHDIAA